MKSDGSKQIAISMHWDRSGAPKVTAKGYGDVADKIIELAKQHGVPIREDQGLARLLLGVNLGDDIPHELYVAVAEVIAFAYSLKNTEKT